MKEQITYDDYQRRAARVKELTERLYAACARGEITEAQRDQMKVAILKEYGV